MSRRACADIVCNSVHMKTATCSSAFIIRGNGCNKGTLFTISLSLSHTETTVFTARGAERQAVWFGRELSSRSKWSAGLLLQLTGFPDAEDTDHEMLKPAATVVCCNFFSSPASRSATYHRGAAQHGHPLLPFHIDRHSLIPLFLHFFFESLALLFILYRLFFIWRSYYQDHCSDEVWD